jgi:hypothetical protein
MKLFRSVYVLFASMMLVAAGGSAGTSQAAVPVKAFVNVAVVLMDMAQLSNTNTDRHRRNSV